MRRSRLIVDVGKQAGQAGRLRGAVTFYFRTFVVIYYENSLFTDVFPS